MVKYDYICEAHKANCIDHPQARLRCIDHLIKSHPQIEKTKFLKTIVPEVVLCVKEINEKCRNSAYQLLNTIADKVLSVPENFKEYVEILIAGLGGSPSYCSATLLALASITYKYNGESSPRRYQVRKAALVTCVSG